jgi:hypothetical protein
MAKNTAETQGTQRRIGESDMGRVGDADRSKHDSLLKNAKAGYEFTSIRFAQ